MAHPRQSNAKTVKEFEMKIYKQKICNTKQGDCLRACIATILQIPIETLPNFHSKRHFLDWIKLLSKLGIEIRYSKSCWIEGYWIASVPSKNFKGIMHSIVMKGQEVFFDPSPKKKYKIGQNLLSERIVIGGYNFIISDIEKLALKFLGEEIK